MNELIIIYILSLIVCGAIVIPLTHYFFDKDENKIINDYLEQGLRNRKRGCHD